MCTSTRKMKAQSIINLITGNSSSIPLCITPLKMMFMTGLPLASFKVSLLDITVLSCAMVKQVLVRLSPCWDLQIITSKEVLFQELFNKSIMRSAVNLIKLSPLESVTQKFITKE
jgi:hypothetical protein